MDYSGAMNAYMVEQSRGLDAFLKPRYPMAPNLRRIQVSRQLLSTDEQVIGTAFPTDSMTLLKEQEFANHVAFSEGASIAMLHGIERMAEQVLSLIRNRKVKD